MLLLLALVASLNTFHADAEAAARTRLRDPESARFRWPTPSPDARGSSELRTCGWVNAKNAYGGYSGEVQFYVVRDKDFKIVSLEFEPDHPAMVSGMCRYLGF
jgi:hypothetical protein